MILSTGFLSANAQKPDAEQRKRMLASPGFSGFLRYSADVMTVKMTHVLKPGLTAACRSAYDGSGLKRAASSACKHEEGQQ